MRLIRNEITEKYHEIELEDSFFGFFKTKIIYRKYGNSIFEFRYPDILNNVGFSTYCSIYPYFNILP